MPSKLEQLQLDLQQQLGARIASLSVGKGEMTVDLHHATYLEACNILRDHEALLFKQLIDLCAVDYQGYANSAWSGPRFCVVLHLLSIDHNKRVRVRLWCADDSLPVVPSVCDIWSSANWYEREAFDLYGVIFDGHNDLRRILTDYGFIGHPFRKDFPISGTVEMRYDPEQRRVIYQPVSIEPREIVPRIVREAGYGGMGSAKPAASTT
ncbi:NADH-quinone oxidoreductase subunit C [Thiomonas sp. FB-Cd]|uniref:NADH-quinone oxidoreductase subunit C n=1 Tax=Thiomonas sp. FB-Cd TaxID=1158292 RepID=UPI0004DEF7D2|nr:NADH-quinone oxidoreductase subunit C [Thiomonas sp. FB-Cd]